MLQEAFVELLRRGATDLPPDVEAALRAAHAREDEGTPAKAVFRTILDNVEMARRNASTPICQDTGTPILYIYHPDDLHRATSTRRPGGGGDDDEDSYLRPNAVDPVTGKNTGTNVGLNAPYMTFNAARQARAPRPADAQGRRLRERRRPVPAARLALARAATSRAPPLRPSTRSSRPRAKGCAPGTLGVGIGGDRATSYLEQGALLRKLDTPNPTAAGRPRARSPRDLNDSASGRWASAARPPSWGCWSARCSGCPRASSWPQLHLLVLPAEAAAVGRGGELCSQAHTPSLKRSIRDLKVGDEIPLNGVVVLARDTAHKYMVEQKPDLPSRSCPRR